MMRQRVLLTAFLCLLTLVAAHAQKGLQIDSLFSGSILDVSDMSRISMSEVSGSDLKPYNLKYFRSISFKADPRRLTGLRLWWRLIPVMRLTGKSTTSEGRCTMPF